MRSGVGRDRLKHRLAGAIPILERGLKIALHEVDRGQKVIGIAVVGREVQSTSKPSFSFGEVLLLEGYASQFGGKARIFGIGAESGFECGPGFLPAFQAGERGPVIKVEIRGSFGGWRQFRDILPLLSLKESLDAERLRVGRTLSKCGTAGTN